MHFAVIADGIVTNIVKSSPEFAAEQGWIEAAAGVGRGWSYNGSIFSPPAAPAAVIVPISGHQFRRAVSDLNAGRRALFETWLETTASEEHRDYFLYAHWIERTNPAVEAARLAMSASQNAVNNFFIKAQGYPV